MGALERLYKEYGDRVAFLFVYVREAHPSDGWQMEDNVTDDVVYEQPATLARRCEIAASCCERLEITMPAVVDDMRNSVDEAYAGRPERLFIIDAAGRIALAGERGPFGFKPEEVADWLERNAR